MGSEYHDISKCHVKTHRRKTLENFPRPIARALKAAHIHKHVTTAFMHTIAQKLKTRRARIRPPHLQTRCSVHRHCQHHTPHRRRQRRARRRLQRYQAPRPGQLAQGVTVTSNTDINIIAHIQTRGMSTGGIVAVEIEPSQRARRHMRRLQCRRCGCGSGRKRFGHGQLRVAQRHANLANGF